MKLMLIGIILSSLMFMGVNCTPRAQANDFFSLKKIASSEIPPAYIHWNIYQYGLKTIVVFTDGNGITSVSW